jgi:hypothetical protein
MDNERHAYLAEVFREIADDVSAGKISRDRARQAAKYHERAAKTITVNSDLRHVYRRLPEPPAPDVDQARAEKLKKMRAESRPVTDGGMSTASAFKTYLVWAILINFFMFCIIPDQVTEFIEFVLG